MPTRNGGCIYSVHAFTMYDTVEELASTIRPQKAMAIASYYAAHNASAKVGLIERIVIIDDKRRIIYEWTFKDGVVKPWQMALRAKAKRQKEVGRTGVATQRQR